MWKGDDGTAVKYHKEYASGRDWVNDVDGERLRAGFTAPMPNPEVDVKLSSIGYPIDHPGCPIAPPDDPHRISEWKRFSEHMEEYILLTTLMKYRASGTLRSSFDLADITDRSVMVWNILKYALRLWNNKGKDNDIEKIAHYACMAWSK